ncbi:MAG: phage/plasmid primase, P4 family [Bacillota bacterium]
MFKELHDLGLSVFPIPKRGKTPYGSWKKYQSSLPTKEEIKKWDHEKDQHNVCIVTGKISDIVVIDVDNIPLFVETGIILPTTPTAKSNRGLHYYFRHPGVNTQIKNAVKLFNGSADIRGDGGYIVAPPSIHPSGTQYEWVKGKSPWKIDFAPLPTFILDLLTTNNNHALKITNPHPYPSPRMLANEVQNIEDILQNGAVEGSRNDQATRIAGHYIGRNFSQKETLTMLSQWNDEKSLPPLPEQEIQSIVNSIFSKHTRGNNKQYILDTPYIRSFIDSNGQEIYERGSFMHTKLAEIIIDELPLLRKGKYFYYYDSLDGLWKQGAEDKIKHIIANKLGIHANNNRVNETYNHVVRLVVPHEGDLPFEKIYSFLLNLKNGVYDLKNNKFTPSFSPHYYHTIKSSFEYNPNATSVHVNKFLKDVLYEEDIPFIHELALTILVRKLEKPALVFFLGGGGNGKSALLKLLSMLAGLSNVSNVPLEALQKDRFAIAELHLKLLNFCGDIGDGYLPQTDILKAATGGDPLYAQNKGKDPFYFISFATQIYSANATPRFKDWSKGMKDRVFPIRMDRVFRGTDVEDVDPLRNIDEEELSGWFNILIEVNKRKSNRGQFTVSEGMKLRREEWFQDMDVVSKFIEEECIVEQCNEGQDQVYISKKELWRAFQHYLTDCGYNQTFNKSSFDHRLKQKGFIEGKKRINSENPLHVYLGLSLSNETLSPF